jgi:glycosyltransferase involved in cell wall biosynthesis
VGDLRLTGEFPDPGSEGGVRILHLRNADRLGGPERLILEQARGRPRVTVAVFGRAADHPVLATAREAGLDARLVRQRGSYDPGLLRRVRRLVGAVAADVVVGHDYKANLLLRLAAGGRPRVAVVHGYTAEDAKIRLFEAVDRRLLAGAKAVVAVAAPLRDLLVSSGLHPGRVHVVENAIPAEAVARAAREGRERLRAAWGLGPEDRAILALGRLSPEKGQDLLLTAFSRIRDPSARLVLVGDGALAPALRRRVAEGHLGETVRFAGWSAEPWACLGAADLFVLPSRREGLPLALLEAMAVGLPIVAADVGGVAGALGGAGRAIPPDRPDLLAAAIAALLGDPEEARLLGRAAAARVRAAFDPALQAQRLQRIYVGAAAG